MRKHARIPRPQRQANQDEHEEQELEDQPPRQEHHRNCRQCNEERYGKLKLNMPKFSGGNDPEEYLSRALKVDKIFHLHNYEEEKKIAMASLEFQDYVLIWWEQVIKRRQEKGEPPITTWNQMKDVMRDRFVPTHYSRDLFKKLQLLKQGTKSVEAYYQEMEIAMIRANIKEDDEQTMACLLNGLNYPIKKIADFQLYSNLLELVQPPKRSDKYKRTTSTPSTLPRPTAHTLKL
jgi:hypothetical protein